MFEKFLVLPAVLKIAKLPPAFFTHLQVSNMELLAGLVLLLPDL